MQYRRTHVLRAARSQNGDQQLVEDLQLIDAVDLWQWSNAGKPVVDRQSERLALVRQLTFK
jgi:hypothetical protein